MGTNHARNGAVIGEGQRTVAKLHCSFDELVRMRGTGEKREIAAAVKLGVRHEKSLLRSSEQAMHVPAMRGLALPVHPQPHTILVMRLEVIAQHFASVPPAGFNAFRPAYFFSAACDFAWLCQQPQGTLDSARRFDVLRQTLELVTAIHSPGAFRPVILDGADAEHPLVAEAGA